MKLSTAPPGEPQPNARVQNAAGTLGTVQKVDWPWEDAFMEEDMIYTILWDDGTTTCQAKGTYNEVDVVLQ